VKGDTMLKLARVRAKRKKVYNKDSAFRVNQKVVDEHKIDRYLKRNNILEHELLSIESPRDGKYRCFASFETIG
jgi:hypothetical protein